MSHAIRCPKCIFHCNSYNAPLGKVVRNPYAGLDNAMHDDCDACNGTGYVPGLIIDAIANAFPKSVNEILTNLRWSGDHYSFIVHGMYVGCELDGYVHS